MTHPRTTMGTTTSTSRNEPFLGSLTHEDRYVLALHFADGLTPIEIASLLPLTPDEVGVTIDRLRDQAKAYLARRQSAA